MVGYQTFFAPPPPAPVGEQALRPADEATPTPTLAPAPTDGGTAGALAGAASEAAAVTSVSSAPALERGEERTESIETDLYTAVFSSHGGRLRSFLLKKYRDGTGPDSQPLDMVAAEAALPLGVYWSTDGGSYANDNDLDYQIEVSGGRETTVTMTASADDGTRVRKVLSVHPDSYVMRLEVEVTGVDDPAVGVAWVRRISDAKGSRFSGKDGPVVYVDGKLHEEASATMKETLDVHGQVEWAGYADHYFLAAYYPEEPTELRFVGAAANGLGEATLIASDARGHVAYNLFIGPKEVRLLGTLGHHLDKAIYLGWFAFVGGPLLQLMLYLTLVTGNYGWSIILLTIGIRVAFYPVNKRQALAMKGMQRIQPELKKIQEKYKDDREQLNKEMMELYRRHKVNPLSGCLPMLLQLPVFLGLYNALMQSIELRHAPFIGWITDLSQPDRLGSLAIPMVSPPGIPVLTLFMGASMIAQQRMTPATGDPMQQRMMMFLPVVFTLMFINFPSGLVLYWFANNIMSIGQQYMTNRSRD